MALNFLKEARRERGYSQASIARELGVAASTYCLIEQGYNYNAARRCAQKLGELLDVDPKRIIRAQEPRQGECRDWMVNARAEKGLSQKTVAEMLGTTQSQISFYEKGVATPRKWHAELLADILGVEKEWFYKGKPDELTRTITWIPTAERKPTKEECGSICEFLVMIDCGAIPTALCFDGEEFFEEFEVAGRCERQTYRVTHWAEMPEPPERAEG